MRRWMIALVGLSGACKAPPEAPTELNELSRYLYREQANEDPEVVAVGLRNLDALLLGVDLKGATIDRSWTLADLTEDDLAGLETRPDRDPALAVGVGVAYESVWGVDDHARAQTEADQRPFEESAQELYDRTFPALDDDPSCFLDRGCTLLETFNVATRKNVLMKLTFELRKDIRWVELEEGRWAMLSRSWYEQPWTGENGNTSVEQSYSIDVWIDGGETTRRFQSLWSESDVGFATSDDTVVATVKIGIDGFYTYFDEAVGCRYHGIEDDCPQ